jgi:hypothetical protein
MGAKHQLARRKLLMSKSIHKLDKCLGPKTEERIKVAENNVEGDTERAKGRLAIPEEDLNIAQDPLMFQ